MSSTRTCHQHDDNCSTGVSNELWTARRTPGAGLHGAVTVPDGMGVCDPSAPGRL